VKVVMIPRRDHGNDLMGEMLWTTLKNRWNGLTF
jgi:hypothetical protein